MWASPAEAGLFGSGEEEITPTQYASLLVLRDINPDHFRKALLPRIEKAMKDGRITQAELQEIEKAAGSVAADFLAAAKAPRFQDSLSKAMEDAKATGRSLGDQLGETLNRHVPDLLDDAKNLFREQQQPKSSGSSEKGAVSL